MKRAIWFSLFYLIHATMLQAAPGKLGEIEASVIKQIENDTAKQFKLGKVKAKCDKAPAKPKEGDSFACSATTKDNRRVNFIAKISLTSAGKYKIALAATNILDPGSINELIKKVLPDIVEQTGEKVALKNVDCGSFLIFANAADITIPCIIKMPSNNQKKKSWIHFTKTLITVNVEGVEQGKPVSDPQASPDEREVKPDTDDEKHDKHEETKPHPEHSQGGKTKNS